MSVARGPRIAKDGDSVLAQLSSILRQILKAPKLKPQAGEHRGAQRYALRAKVKVQMISPEGSAAGHTLMMWLRDISSAGVGLMHSEPVRLGQELLIHIPDLDDMSPLIGVVRRCERMSKDI